MSSQLADSLELCYGLRGALTEMRAGQGELEGLLDGMFTELPSMVEGIAARQQEIEQTAADRYQQETDRFRQQIAAVVEQLTVVERDQKGQAAELQSARDQNAAMADELAEQQRQTQHWQQLVQQKTAEIEGNAARQQEIEETTAAAHRQEIEKFRQQIAELVGQQTLSERDLTAQAAELQTSQEQNAAMAGELAEQRQQTQHWQETARQKTAEIEQITAAQREAEQVAATNHRQETDQLRQQIVALSDRQALAEREQAAQATELQSAHDLNAAMGNELAGQKRQTQHWQELAQQKVAEIEGIVAGRREAEQAVTAAHQTEAQELRQQIAELLERQTLLEHGQNAGAAELQTVRQQYATATNELAEQKRQTQHWHELAQQKAAEIEGLAARQQETELAMAAVHQKENDQLRRQIAELLEREGALKRDRSAEAAELQTVRKQCEMVADELAKERHQAQQWQEAAQQKSTEIDGLVASRQAAEQSAAAAHRQEADQLRQQISELLERQAISERGQTAQAAELQTAREQNATMAGELAEQKRQTQHWQEMAQRTLTEVEAITARERQSEMANAAAHQQETDHLRRQIAELLERQAVSDRAQTAQAAELESAREQNAAIVAELAELRRQSQQWQETAQQKLTEIEEIKTRHQEIEQATAAAHQVETDQLRRYIAELLDRQSALERESATPSAELQAAHQQNAAMADELAEQKRQAQYWQEMAQGKLAEIEGLAASQREAEQAAAAAHQRETERFRQEIAELVEQQTLAKREQAMQAAELQAARELNASITDQLAEHRRQAQRWQEMADCARQVAELRIMFEHRQACLEAQDQAAEEEAAALALQSIDSGRQLDHREDSPAAQPPQDHQASQASAGGEHAAEAPHHFSEPDGMLAKRQAQWEELLRSRSRAQK